VPYAEEMSCLNDRPPLAGIYPASGQPPIMHWPQHLKQVAWSEFYNLAADHFTVFSKAFVFLRIKAKGVIQCLEMAQKQQKQLCCCRLSEWCVNPYLER